MKSLVRSGGVNSLTKYDPDKGLKTIAVAKMAAKEYARVGDVVKVEQAIRVQLDAEADFVLWWDVKGPGAAGKGRPAQNAPDQGHFPKAGNDGLPTTQLISRWRKNLNDPKAFEAAYERIRARTVKSIRFESTAHVGQNTGEYEWYTPAEYIEAAREVLGDIDLDPASTSAANNVVKAAQIFTAEDDGLIQPWHGRVWMNPPYSQPLVGHFADKFAVSVRAGDVTAGIVLVNNATETEWFNTIASVAAAVCFPKGRVRFWSPGKESATPLQGQAVLYAGPEVETFCDRFASFGIVARIVRPNDPATPV